MMPVEKRVGDALAMLADDFADIRVVGLHALRRP